MKKSLKAILAEDRVLAALIKAAGRFALEPRRHLNPYESLASAIAHQQLNGTAARRILERFRALYPEGAFPTPRQLLATPAEQLRGVGFSYAKVRALHDLAAKTIEGVVPTADELQILEDAAIIERLTAVRGIGRWTVEMMLIFQLGRTDVLPVHDFGVRNGFRLAYGLRRMPTARALEEFGARWRPHRSRAAWYLWRAVDLSRANALPTPPKPAPRLAMEKPVRKVKPAARRLTPKKARPATRKSRSPAPRAHK